MLNAKVKVSAIERPKTLNRASQQWRERPADERFETLDDLLAATKRHRDLAMQGKTPLNKIQVMQCGEGTDVIHVVGAQSGITLEPTHWAFGQLCQRAGAPANYLRALPARLAVQNLQHGLDRAENDDDMRLLIQRPEHGHVGTLRALTSTRYKRVFNYEVANALCELRERQPAWQFPEPFRTVKGTKQGVWGTADGKPIPIAFASDHDMFVFLCDYEHGVELPDGNVLARGFFVENSEVGDAAFKVTMFLFDFVCSNILVWGARNVVEIRLNHVGRIRDRVLANNSEVLKALSAYGSASARVQKEQIQQAQKRLLGKDPAEVLSTLFGRKSLGLSKGDIVEAQTVAANTPRYGDPRSAWAIVNGLTEVSQRSPHADQRIKLDRAAGEVLQTFVF